jgi:hypothetical protein
MKMKSGEPLAWRNLCFESASMNAQLVRAIDLGCAGGSTIAECLMTAALVEDEDEVSWYEAWNATARRVEAIAEQALAENHLISARQTYLRASMYYRAAEFYMHAPAHLERALEAASRMKECFLKAIPYLPFKVEPVRVPLEETTLPCYFYCAPSSAKTRAPALIISSGIDDTAEEVHFKIATAAVMRGYNVLVLQGPGQGQALREQGLKFRPDWETVVSSTVDYVVGRPEVDWNRRVW